MFDPCTELEASPQKTIEGLPPFTTFDYYSLEFGPWTTVFIKKILCCLEGHKLEAFGFGWWNFIDSCAT